jgi:hypothetical protein
VGWRSHLALPWHVIFIVSTFIQRYEEVCTAISVCKW